MRFVIEGGYALRGEVEIGGAKNAALPIMAATLLTSDYCLLENIPDIEDTRLLLSLLDGLGVSARVVGKNMVAIKADSINTSKIPTDLATRMRGSFLVVGPLLTRFGRVEAPHPGGCAIGTRPVSVDLKGFQSMGAQLHSANGTYAMNVTQLVGQRISLDYPSHTGTENLLMAACLARGTTIIENASVEPEVVDLANCLRAMGARIYGAGTGIIRVDGVERLHGVVYRVMPDRLEAGTFAIAAAISGGSVSFDGAVSQYLGALTSKLGEAGVAVTARKDRYTVAAGPRILPADIHTYPYPGFPTDLQAPYAALMTQADGECSIHETMYDGRMKHAKELRKMGANIKVRDRTAIIRGPTRLHGAEVKAPDIRSGAAVVLAALVAEGTTTVSGIRSIDRGYERLDEKLNRLGARIRRENGEEEKAPVSAISCSAAT